MGNEDTRAKRMHQSFAKRLVARLENLRGTESDSHDDYPGVSLKDFTSPEKGFMTYIGQGGFGKVMAMRKTSSKKYFAVKAFSKAKLVAKDEVDQALNELNLLMRIPHNHFVVNLFYAFQDKENLYMCTNLMVGGSLQHALSRVPGNLLPLERTTVLAAELVLAVEFLHANRIVHRDVKPDNILLDNSGHMRLTDFNISLTVTEEEEDDAYHRDGWGTRGFRAPEIYLRKGHGLVFACDWWSVGAVIYVLLTGKLPYAKKREDESNVSLVTRMRAEEFNRTRLPDENSRSLCDELLRYKPEKRLGCSSGPKSEVLIMTHPFFQSIDWDKYESGSFLTEPANGSISSYAENFDATLDDKIVMQCLQKNLGLTHNSDADLDDEYPPLSAKGQSMFSEWAFNVDFILERESKPMFTLVHTISSMSPEDLRKYVVNASGETLKALSKEIKQYKEQAMLENYQHVKAEIKNEQLIQKNLKLTQELAVFRAKLVELGVPLDSVRLPAKKESGGSRMQRQRSNDEEIVDDVVDAAEEFASLSDNSEKTIESDGEPVKDLTSSDIRGARRKRSNDNDVLLDVGNITESEVILFDSVNDAKDPSTAVAAD